MDHFADFLTLLGQHYVLVGCVELIAAVVLVGILPRRQKSRAARAADATGTEQLMMRELSRQEDTKTFLDDGNIDRFFYLVEDTKTGLWMIIDNSTNGQPGATISS